MPGPNQAFKAGAVKPKNLKKTILRLVGYLTRSRLPLLFVLLCLLTSVATNLGGSYMVRPIANLLIDPDRTLQEKLSGLAADAPETEKTGPL